MAVSKEREGGSFLWVSSQLRALLFGIYIGAPDFRNLPYLQSTPLVLGSGLLFMSLT